MAAGYEDIENWSRQQNNLLDEQEQKQNEITQKQTQLNIDELNREKNKIDTDVNKTTSGLYTEYQKQANQYGVEAERQAKLGLANSGYSETAQTNLYNTYQKNITETLNNARDLKADFDFQISKAQQTGDITKAQNALEIYKSKMQLLTQEYEFKNNREQFLYQKDQDKLAQSNWEREYAYQQQRDAVSDSQWEKQYALSKKAKASSSSKKSSSKKSSKSLTVSSGNNATTSQENSNNSENTQDSTFSMIAEKVLNFSKPNSQGRKIMLQGLVKAGTLTQGQADKLLSAK